MAAGEAHWQHGIVERRIGTFLELFNKLQLEDVFDGATNQTIVDSVCEAKIEMAPTTALLLVSGSLGDPDSHCATRPKHRPTCVGCHEFAQHLAINTMPSQ